MTETITQTTKDTNHFRSVKDTKVHIRKYTASKNDILESLKETSNEIVDVTHHTKTVLPFAGCNDWMCLLGERNSSFSISRVNAMIVPLIDFYHTNDRIERTIHVHILPRYTNILASHLVNFVIL